MRLAVVWGGRGVVDTSDENPLQFVGKSVKRVIATLEANDWLCHEVDSETLEEYNSWLQNFLVDNKPLEFLFLFTGHGVYGNSKSQVGFQVCFHNGKGTLPQIIDETLKAFKNYKEPEKMAFVIDSCYSGDALTERYNDKNFEILTPTAGSKAYEDEKFQSSVFVHYFCEIFNSLTAQNEIDLEQISEFSSQDSRQTSLHSKALAKDKIIIGYNKEINEIYQIFQEKYPTSDNFKKAINIYLKDNALNFQTIQSLTDYKKLFAKLLEEKECLYCLLKELNLHQKYINRVKEVADCRKLKREIAQYLS